MRRRRFLKGLLATPVALLVPKAWLPVSESAVPPPGRWFKLTPTDPAVADHPEAQAWLDQCDARILDEILRVKRMMDEAGIDPNVIDWERPLTEAEKQHALSITPTICRGRATSDTGTATT
ncbi:MAG: hypothetical protein V3V08_23405 [Nannocystaceae bacterium]